MAIRSLKTGLTNRSLLVGNTFYDPAATWLIQRVNGTGSSATITFSSIPQTYKSLQIRTMLRNNDTQTVQTPLYITFNSDTGTNYTYHRLLANGTSVSASGGTAFTSALINSAGAGGSTLANTHGTSLIDIIDYASTSKYKTLRYFAGVNDNSTSTSFGIALGSSLWLNTNAITSITVTVDNAFSSTSTVALYGMVG